MPDWIPTAITVVTSATLITVYIARLPTRNEVQAMIDNAISPINTHLSYLRDERYRGNGVDKHR